MSFFRLTERLSGLFLARDVATDADDADGSPGRTLTFELGFAPRSKPAILAIALRDPIVDVLPAITADVRGVPNRLEHGPDVVRMDDRRDAFRAVIEGIRR